MRADGFAREQHVLNEAAAGWVAGIRDAFQVPDAEAIALHLWTRYPHHRALAMTITSDRAWSDANAVNRRQIWQPSNWVPVNAFCTGTTAYRDEGGGEGHWNYMRALPIVLETNGWGHLPVGVVSIASSRAGKGGQGTLSKLARLNSGQLLQLDQLLLKLAKPVLDPRHSGPPVAGP